MYKNLAASWYHLINQIFIINCFIEFCPHYIKNSKDSSAKYYWDNKERLQKQARERYQNLSKEEKRQYGQERN